MTTQETHGKLKAKFGETAITGLVENTDGDSWVQVAPGSVADVCLFLRDNEEMKFDGMQCLSGVDWKDRLGVVYHLYSYSLKHRLVLHVDVKRSENPLEASMEEVASVAEVWPTANWHEREAYDMVGVRFSGHPDFRRILCPDDWEGWPLRKDYKVADFYRGMPVPYPTNEDPDLGGTWVFKDRFGENA